MQRDYILRLIEQIGAILRALFRRLQTGTATPAERETDLQHAAQLGGLDLILLRVSDMHGVVQMVSPGGELDPSRTWLAAETLYLDGIGAEMEERGADARASYAKAATLFRMMAPSWALPTGFPEATERTADIEARLAGLAGS